MTGGGGGDAQGGAEGRASAPDPKLAERPSLFLRSLRGARPQAQPGSFRWARRPGARPLVIGHRGARAHAPENTLPAFDRAMDDGADGVELDVRTTADGVVVVLHDVDLARVTAARDLRVASRLSAQELRAVELAGGARVPTLAEVLAWAEARGALLNVELKHDVPDRGALARETARLLRERPSVASRVLLSSFEPRLLAWMALLARSVPRALLVHAGQRLAWTRATPLAARALGCVAVHAQHTLCSPAIVHALRRAGFVVNAWTVNDGREARDLDALGLDALITDDPAAIRGALALTPAADADADADADGDEGR